MPRAPEIPSTYAALDSLIAVDGEPLDAHTLREIARMSNRNVAKGEPLLSLTFRGTGAGVEDETALGVVMFRHTLWTMFGPFVVPKRPGLKVAQLDLVAQVSAGATAYAMVGTTAAPLDPASGVLSTNVLAMAGDGTHKTYGTLEVDLSEEAGFEVLTVGIYTPSLSALIDPAVYGGVNAGSVHAGTVSHIVTKDPATADWFTAPRRLADDGVVALLYRDDATANKIYVGGARRIVWNYEDEFWVNPPFSVTIQPGLRFELYDPGKVRLDGIAVWAKDLS